MIYDIFYYWNSNIGYKETNMKSFLLMLLAVVFVLKSQLVKAICNVNIAESTPNIRFTTNGDGLVTDTQTGLMWMRCSIGQTWDGSVCNGSSTTFTWNVAFEVAASEIYSGFEDWRLPNVKELSSIVEDACSSPSINEGIFPTTPSSEYWSSSPHAYAGARDAAWVVRFSDGNHFFDTKENSNVVRLVRTGQ